MTNASISAQQRSGISWDKSLFPIAFALIGYAIVLLAPQVLNDGDTYWHIAAGNWIIQHGAVPHADPFSYTLAGAPWVAQEWLSEVVMALAYKAAAWNGIVMLFGAATALAFGLFAYYLARWLSQPAAFVVGMLGIACVGPSLLARPHILALPILVLWTAGLILANERGKAPSLVLLPLMVVWANLHGSFIFGLALAAAIALEALVEAKGGRVRVALRWGMFLAAATGASLLTPNNWHGLLFGFQLMRMTQLSRIGEWSPTDFHTLQPLELALMTLLYVGFSRGIRLPVFRIIMLIGLLHEALQHSRHQMLAGIVGGLLLAGPLGETWGNNKNESMDRFAKPRWAFAGLAGALLLTAIRIMHPLVRSDDRMSPMAAINHVPADILREPVFNSYDFGGYLIFNNIKPFIDGRADLYGDRFLSDYAAILAPNRGAFEKMVEKYKVRWTILDAGAPAVDMIDALPQWHRLYADRVAVVYVRDDTAP